MASARHISLPGIMKQKTLIVLSLLVLLCLTPVFPVSAQETDPTGSPDQTGPLPVKLSNPIYLPVISRSLEFTINRLGPFYGRVLRVEQDPYNAGTVYAMTFGSGMYKSTDYGGSWFPISTGISQLVLQSMAVDPVTPNTLYAGTYSDLDGVMPYNGVFKSSDGGATWAPTGEMANIWNGVRYRDPVVYALAVDPHNPSRLFAGTRMRGLPDGSLGGGGVFRSENGGASWAPVNQGLPGEDLYVYDVVVDPDVDGRVYAALHEHGLYRSDDHGSSWYPVNSSIYAGRAIAVDPFNSEDIFFGAVKKLSAHRSQDEGRSWYRIGGTGWDVMVGALSADPYHSGIIYAGILNNNTDFSLMRSTDYGDSWTSVASLYTWGKVAFSPDRQTAYTSVDSSGPFKSVNAGVSWYRSAWGLSGYAITGMAVSPTDANLMVASTYPGGVYLSRDGGASWELTASGMGDLQILALAMNPANPNVLYITTRDSSVYRSVDAGKNWLALTGGYPATVNGPAQENELIPSVFEVLHLPEQDDLRNMPFEPAPDQAMAAAAAGMATGNTIAISPFNPQIVLAGTTGRGLYRLNNATWSPTGLASGTVHSIYFDPTVNGRVLAAVDAASGGLWVSADNGQTWQPSNQGLAGRTVYSLVQSKANPLILLAGTDSGVYHSTDGGLTWAQAGLAGQAVTAMGLMTGEPELYFAGNNTGAYYSSNFTNWFTVNASLDSVGIRGFVQSASARQIYVYTRLAGIVRVGIK